MNTKYDLGDVVYDPHGEEFTVNSIFISEILNRIYYSSQSPDVIERFNTMEGIVNSSYQKHSITHMHAERYVFKTKKEANSFIFDIHTKGFNSARESYETMCDFCHETPSEEGFGEYLSKVVKK